MLLNESHRLVALALISVPFASIGATTTSVTRAAFQAAIAQSTISSQNFDSLANGTILGTLNGVTYSSSVGSPLVTNVYLTSTGLNGLGHTGIGYFLPTESATFAFSSPVTAFAIDINTANMTDGAYKVTTSLGDTVLSLFEVFPNQTTGQFIGFVSSAAFSNVTVSAITTGYSYTLDTMTYGSAAAVVPEPTASALLLSGLAILALVGSTRHRSNRRTYAA